MAGWSDLARATNPGNGDLELCRLRTNHQSVMEHGWCPTSPARRTPVQIAGRFAVLLDFLGFLILDQPPKCYGTWLVSDQLPWSDTLEPPPKCYGIWACATSPPRRTLSN